MKKCVVEKYYWYNLNEDTNKTIVHLLYEDTTNTDNPLNLATFGYMKAIFYKVNQMTPVNANDKSSSFNYTFSNYLHFFLLQLYSYSNSSDLQVIAEDKGFKQTLMPEKARPKAPGLLNTNNTIRSDPGYYYEKVDGIERTEENSTRAIIEYQPLSNLHTRIQTQKNINQIQDAVEESL